MRVEIISVDSIQVGDRSREEFKNMDRLIESIKTYGVIQPLAVHRVFEKTEAGGHTIDTLLAGERRLRAVKEVGLTKVPVRIFVGDLESWQIREIELEENIQREDLRWQEKDALIKEIHELKQKRHGKAKSGRPSAGKSTGEWGVRDTAKHLGQDASGGGVAKAISRASVMEVFPEIKLAKTAADADKMVQKVTDKMIADELAQRAVADLDKTPKSKIRKRLMDAYIIGDFLEESKSIQSKSIDFVEIDSPYATDLLSARKPATLDDYQEWDREEYYIKIMNTLREAWRVTKSNAWIVVWFAPEPWFESCYQAIISAGFKCRRMPCIWTRYLGKDKEPALQYRNADISIGNAYEMFFYARKGNAVLAKQGRTNVFDYLPVKDKAHNTEKPTELYKDILGTFCHPRSTILSPYLGSGNIILAAADLQHEAFGYDLSKSFKDQYTIKVNSSLPPNYASDLRK